MLTLNYIGSYEKRLNLKSDERIKGTDEVVFSKECKDGLEHGMLFVKATTNPEVFHYGFRQMGEGIYHGDGYVWSSRVGVLNIEFDQDFVEVIIDNCAGYCMHLEDAKKYLPEGYHFEKRIMFKEEEVYYYPVKDEE